MLPEEVRAEIARRPPARPGDPRRGDPPEHRSPYGHDAHEDHQDDQRKYSEELPKHHLFQAEIAVKIIYEKSNVCHGHLLRWNFGDCLSAPRSICRTAWSI